jgi:phage gpG-like protein
MKEFSSIGGFIAHMAAMEAAVALELHRGLKKCATAIEGTAKSEFGVYQGDVGAFSAWAPLAESTQEQRKSLGYTPDDPLLRSGDLRDTVTHEVNGTEAVIGSDSDVMVYQELGTPTIPPRAVLGPAAIRNKPLIEKTLGAAVAKGLLYGSGVTLTALE